MQSPLQVVEIFRNHCNNILFINQTKTLQPSPSHHAFPNCLHSKNCLPLHTDVLLSWASMLKQYFSIEVFNTEYIQYSIYSIYSTFNILQYSVSSCQLDAQRSHEHCSEKTLTSRSLYCLHYSYTCFWLCLKHTFFFRIRVLTYSKLSLLRYV